MVVYPAKGKKLAILTLREHLCGFFESSYKCGMSGNRLDTATGHQVCFGCERILIDSGLRICDICDTEYINKLRHQDADYETNCPRCVEAYEL